MRVREKAQMCVPTEVATRERELTMNCNAIAKPDPCFSLASGWGSGSVDFPYLVTPADAISAAFNQRNVKVTNFLTNKISSSALANQDLCLVFVNADSGEGYLAHDGVSGDRPDLHLQKDGDNLVKTVAQSCGGGSSKTVVIVHSVGAVVVEDWIGLSGVKGLLFAHLPGQESGNSLVSLFLRF